MESGRGWLTGDWPSTGAFSTLLRRPGLRASCDGVLATKSERKMLASIHACTRSMPGLLLRSICGTENSSQQTYFSVCHCQQSLSTWYSATRTRFWLKKLYLKWYTAKGLTVEFPEKSWTKRGVNKLLKKFCDTDTVNSAARQRQTAQCPYWINVEWVETVMI